MLQTAIIAVQNKESVSFSREELYRAVEDLCVHKMGGKLYERLKEECSKHITIAVGALSNQVSES